MAIPANTIDEVLSELDRIIEQTVTENNFLGIFAYVYRRTTAQIKVAIEEKQFEDNQRMEHLDVAFANMYLTAYQNYANKQSCSASWKEAFDAKNDTITILQQIMLGMNAHINLDLGIASATFAPGNNLQDLKNDFLKVNLILKGLINEMQDRISKVSRLMIILDWTGKNTDELMVNFSMVKARQQAWGFACGLAEVSETERKTVIENKDQRIAEFAYLLKSPPGKFLNLVLKFISLFEEKNVKTIITKLEKD